MGSIILVGAISIISVIVGAYIGHFYQKKQFDQRMDYEDKVRAEERFLELLKKLNSYIETRAALRAELENADKEQRNKILNRLKEKASEFCEVKAIAQIFGDDKINDLVDEIYDTFLKADSDSYKIFKKTKKWPRPKDLESGKLFLQKKEELISHIRIQLGEWPLGITKSIKRYLLTKEDSEK